VRNVNKFCRCEINVDFLGFFNRNEQKIRDINILFNNMLIMFKMVGFKLDFSSLYL